MTNILIIDQLQQTGVLMKSLLSNYYGVSLSENLSEAIKKIETALFDVVIMELERPNSDTEKFIKETKEILPQLPIIILSEHQDSLQSIDCLKIMRRPFRCATLMESINDGLSRYNASTDTNTHHRAITYNVEISQDENKSVAPLKCSTIDLSLLGMMIEPLIVFPGRSQDNEKTQFQSFFKTLCPEGRIYSKPLRTNILLKEQEPIGLDARIAFMENSPDDVFKRAGLSFKDSDQQKNRLLELLKQTQ
jgi:CheY-like chemotaxis protein